MRKKVGELLRLSLPLELEALQRAYRTLDLAPITAATATLVKLSTSADEQIENIERDPSLTRRGIEKSLPAVATTTDAGVDRWIAQHVTPALARVQAQRAALLKAVAAPPTEAEERRFAEIRRSFEGVDPIEVQALYLSAPAEIQRALETAPLRPYRVRPDASLTLMPLVEPTVATATQEVRARQAAPEKAAALDEQQAIASLLASAASTAKKALVEALTDQFSTGPAGPDPGQPPVVESQP